MLGDADANRFEVARASERLAEGDQPFHFLGAPLALLALRLDDAGLGVGEMTFADLVVPENHRQQDEGGNQGQPAILLDPSGIGQNARERRREQDEDGRGETRQWQQVLTTKNLHVQG